MKHAAVKEKMTERKMKTEPVTSVKRAKKSAEIEAISPVKNTKTKAVKKTDSAIEKVNFKKKIAKTAAVVSKSKTTAVKVAPLLPVKKIEKRNRRNKTVSAISVKRAVAKAKKIAPVIIAGKLKLKKKKGEPAISPQKQQRNKLTKQVLASAVSVQKIKPQVEKPPIIARAPGISTKCQKIKSAVNVGKINAALKAIEAAQTAAAQTKKTEKRKSGAAARKSKVAEAKIENPASEIRTKPKNVKQIGAAVFRGRKNRYDFQVYPLDFAFEDVSAIYVISKRKIDGKKRGHHALVCIGQTDSVVDELRKHTGGKCVTKHEANVISILPEPNEKKRLKIEQDLRAAHSIVCNLAAE